MFNRTEMYFTGYSLVTTTLLLRFNIERRCNRSRTTVNQPSTQSLIAIVSTAVLCHIWSPWVKRCRQSRDFKKFGSAAAQQLRMGLSTSKNTPLPRSILSLVVKRYQRRRKNGPLASRLSRSHKIVVETDTRIDWISMTSC